MLFQGLLQRYAHVLVFDFFFPAKFADPSIERPGVMQHVRWEAVDVRAEMARV
jgi:hypothetical protein